MSVLPARRALLLVLLLAVPALVPLAPVAAGQAGAGPVRIQDAAHDACGTGGGPFADVAAALACAIEGATILVEPGTYAGNLSIGTSVTLCSTSVGGTACEPRAAETLLDGAGAIQAVRIEAANVTLQGFTIRNPEHSSTGLVDPSLVVVNGAGVRLLDNVLRQPAAPLLPGQSRAYTLAINLVDGHDALVERNVVESLPSSRGGTGCAHAPCKTVAILHGAGLRMIARANTIDLSGAGDSVAIWLSADDAVVDGNKLRLSAGRVDGAITSVGIRGPESGTLANATLRGNDIAPSSTEVPATAYGVYAKLRGAIVEANTFRHLLHGLYLRSDAVGDNVARANAFERNNEGIRNYAPSTLLEDNTFTSNVIAVVLAGAPSNGGSSAGVVLRDNAIDSGNQLALRLLDEVPGIHVDAQENDWSAYTRADIRERIENPSDANTIDVACFIDEDGQSRVCPPTLTVEATPQPQSWRREIAFNATIVEGGRPIERIRWDFGDGNTSDDLQPNVLHVYDMPGAYEVRVVVTDAESYQTTTTSTVHVVNSPPVMELVEPQSVLENKTLRLDLHATDADGDALTWSVADLPEGAAFNAAKTSLEWTPSFVQMGNYTLTFTAHDGLAAASTEVPIEVLGSNSPPWLEPIGSKAGAEGKLLTFHVHASDPDTELGQRIRMQAIGLPRGATWIDYRNGTALFSWTPDHLQSGDYKVIFEAQDGHLEVREVVQIAIVEVNRPPVIDPMANQTVNETGLLEFILSGSDPDGSNGLAYAALKLPPGATFDESRRIFSWRPSFDHAGTHTVTFSVTDGVDTAQGDVHIDVLNTNRAPTFAHHAPRQALANRTLLFAIHALDADGDAIVYGAESLPQNASFHPAMRVFSWRPTTEQVGTHAITFTASDGQTSTRVEALIVVNPNLPPVLVITAPDAIPIGYEVILAASGSYDPEATGLVTYSWDFNASDGFQPQRVGQRVSWKFTSHGYYDITLQGRDADGFVSQKTLQVAVDDAGVLVLRVLEAPPNIATSTLAEAVFTLTDGTPVANTTVDIRSYYQPTATSPPQLEHRTSAVTDEHGRAVFVIGRDMPLFNIPGRHVIEASATAATSFLGNQEGASTTLVYTILL